jgi:hypothetical protein
MKFFSIRIIAILFLAILVVNSEAKTNLNNRTRIRKVLPKKINRPFRKELSETENVSDTSIK